MHPKEYKERVEAGHIKGLADAAALLGLETDQLVRLLLGADTAKAERYVDDHEAAAVLHLSETYLRQLRLKGGGPPFSKFGRAVRYRLSDLYAWAASKSVTSTTAG
jgi:helix-turn-helix protein